VVAIVQIGADESISGRDRVSLIVSTNVTVSQENLPPGFWEGVEICVTGKPEGKFT